MRSPILWIVGWILATTIFVMNWPEDRWLASAFWIGWSMSIFGQDLRQWLQQRKRD